MPLSILHTRAKMGIEALPVTVETDIALGMPKFSIVGLPETAVKESKDRIRSALKNCQFEFPCRRITVNLAPADLPKQGAYFDLPIALGILIASGQLSPTHVQRYEFIGELALSGELRPVPGILSIAWAVSQQGKRELIVPRANAEEAVLVCRRSVLPADHLLTISRHLNEEASIQPQPEPYLPASRPAVLDLVDVFGQHQAKRGLEIAAAGGHNLLFVGSPGAGKTMLASRLPSILPPMTEQEAIETMMVASALGQPVSSDNFFQRPFRAPHHSISDVAMVGGGRPPKPGEISLAHHGVLFLDELPEFSRHVLETLREPMESGYIHIARVSAHVTFPANFQFVAAMNPCPCGYLGSPTSHCRCSPAQVKSYTMKLSGPLLDRIDMRVMMSPPVDLLADLANEKGDTSQEIQQRVLVCRERQHQRASKINSQLTNKEVQQYCQLNLTSKKRLQQAIHQYRLSARSYYRLLKVARTIADLEGSSMLAEQHIVEAINYRCCFTSSS